MKWISNNWPWLCWLVPAGMCIGALWPAPYAYYQFLRFVVFIAAAIVLFLEFGRAGLTPWVAGFGIAALLFNPFAPIYLSREVWAPIDVATAVLFTAHLVVAWRHDRKRNQGD